MDSPWSMHHLNLSSPDFSLNSLLSNHSLLPLILGNSRLNKRLCRCNGLSSRQNGCVNSKSCRHNNRLSSNSPNSKKNGYANNNNISCSFNSSSNSSNSNSNSNSN